MKSLRNYIVEVFRKLKGILSKIYHARGTPHEIALGAALGAFWGVFPTFGLSTILTLLLYRLVKFNVLVAISSAFISNPLTSPFWLMLSFKIGSFFTNSQVTFDYKTWYEQFPSIGYTLLLGSFILSSFTAVLVYFFAKWVVEKRRRRLKFKLEERKNG